MQFWEKLLLIFFSFKCTTCFRKLVAKIVRKCFLHISQKNYAYQPYSQPHAAGHKELYAGA